MVLNLFHKAYEPREHLVAQRLLTGEAASFDDLTRAAGMPHGRQLPKQKLHMVLMMIEDQCGVVVKARSEDYGMIYRYLPDEEFDPTKTLTKWDARSSEHPLVRNWRGKIRSSGAPRRF